MYIRLGNTDFNLDAEITKDEFMSIYRGIIRGIDINDAWKIYSKEKRKLKKK